MFNVKSLLNQRHVQLTIKGQIPQELNGTLYRVGPALVERNGLKKNSLIEGDGFVRSLTLSPENNKATFVEKFIQTEKFQAEQKQNKFIYRTIATKSPLFWKNFGFTLSNLANVSVLVWQNKLLALDEMQSPFELDLKSLESRGELDKNIKVMAHEKWCTQNKEYILPSVEFFPDTKVKFLKLKNNGEQEVTPYINLPSCGYVHDWFMTENYFIFVLPPLHLNLKKILPLGLGLCTHSEALSYRSDEKNRIVVINRKSLNKIFEGEVSPHWFWHAAGASEQGHKISITLPLTPFEMLNPDSKLLKSDLVRYEIDLERKSVQELILLSQKVIEFPAGNSESVWFLSCSENSETLNRLARFDSATGKLVTLDFDQEQTLMSPVVVKSHILLEAHDGQSKTSRFYIIKNENENLKIEATVELDQELPFSFHGCWNFAN